MRGKRIHLAVTNDLVHDRRMGRICRTLAEAGHDVTLIGRQRRGSGPFSPRGFDGVRLRCRFHRGPLFYAEYNIRLAWWMIRHQADIRCACDLDTVLAVRWASWWRRGRTVYDAHEYFTGVPELSGRPKVRAIWAWIARLTIPRFDLRYTVGEELARRMASEYGCPFSVIRNIEPAPKSPAENPGFSARENILLYQGAMNAGRGLYTAIEALQHLPAWELWLAGEGDLDAALQAYATKCGVSDRVRFLGWVAPAALPDLLRKARISLNLRESGSINDYYSLPNKFFDALQAGLPSIHMAYPEYKAICERFACAVLLPEVRAGAVVEAVHRISDNPANWEAMAAESLRAGKAFTWEAESDTLRHLYASLCPPDNTGR